MVDSGCFFDPSQNALTCSHSATACRTLHFGAGKMWKSLYTAFMEALTSWGLAPYALRTARCILHMASLVPTIAQTGTMPTGR